MRSPAVTPKVTQNILYTPKIKSHNNRQEKIQGDLNNDTNNNLDNA